jgi:integral membrane protein (TIGR00529 family)
MFPLVKLAGVFGLVIVLLRLTSQVGLALAVGAAILGLFFSLSPREILNVFGGALVDTRSLLVAVVVTLILLLSTSMECLGQMEELLGKFRGWASGKRWGIVAFPALIGLLPMPGGAVFSAPMLDSFDQEQNLIPSLKSFLNYWYRHIWEYWWPLYPSLLLMCAIVGLDLWKYILFSIPMTGVAAFGGLFELLRVPHSKNVSSLENGFFRTAGTWRALLPLVLAILPGVAFGISFPFFSTLPGWPSLPKETGLVVGLFAAIGWIWWAQRIRPKHVRQILLNPKLPRMWVVIAGVFLFNGIMEKSGAAHQVGDVLIQLKIPLVWVAVFLPMIIGAISGWTIAFVGTVFPILVMLIRSMGAADIKLPLTILAFVSGFTGVMVSPVHLCLILSNEYFHASWAGVYRRLWLPATILLGGGVGYFWVLRLWLG